MATVLIKHAQTGEVKTVDSAVVNEWLRSQTWVMVDTNNDGLPDALTTTGAAVSGIGDVPGLVAALNGRVVTVDVTTGSEARPATSSKVLWVGGTVKPTNMLSTDLWLSATSTGSSDTTAPSVPTGLTTSAVSASGFTASWTASTDNVGVTGYDVLVNGSVVASPTGTSSAVTGLSAATTYSVQVRARDAAGNVSASTSAVSVTTSASSDTTAPTVPSGVAASAITSTGFALSWTASTDNVGVTAYDVQLNGVSKATPTTNSATLTGLTASTAYSVQVRARDAAGNYSALSSAVSVTTTATSGSPVYSVFGSTAHPGSLTKGTDGPVKVATAFYTFSSGATGWRNVGGRLYVPAGITMPTSCEVSVWEGATPDLSAAPSRTATLTGIVSGQWNEVRWATALAVTPGTPFWVGYRFTDGSYLAVGSQSSVGIKSGGTDNLYEAAANEFGNRSYFRYDSGSNGNTQGHWGVDCLVDTGA